LLWIAVVLSAIGTWMQIIAQSLLALRLTGGSPLALGGVALAQACSFFVFALIGGGAVDRFEKRKLLAVTQTILVAIALLLAWLTSTGLLRYWMLAVAAFCSGAVLSFDQPGRSALFSLLVPRADLPNAISLQTAVFNGASAVGPALAGITAQHFGFTTNFLLNALSYCGVLVALALIQTREQDVLPAAKSALAPSIHSALREIRNDKIIPWALAGYGWLLFFGPSSQLLLPAFASSAGFTADQLGLLFTGIGVGVIAGSVVLASLRPQTSRGATLLAALVLWPIALVGFAFSPNLPLIFTALLCMGAAQGAAGASTVTLLQTRVPVNMRGRVMSLNTLLIMGVRPLGDFPASAMLNQFDVHTTALVTAALIGAFTLYLWARSALAEDAFRWRRRTSPERQ
jgi:MFS family permease